jgi:hypothetical protein
LKLPPAKLEQTFSTLKTKTLRPDNGVILRPALVWQISLP